MMQGPLLGARPDFKDRETIAKRSRNDRVHAHAKAVEPACYGNRNDTNRERIEQTTQRQSTIFMRAFYPRGVRAESVSHFADPTK